MELQDKLIDAVSYEDTEYPGGYLRRNKKCFFAVGDSARVYLTVPEGVNCFIYA